MAKPVLDAQFWTRNFAVTQNDVNWLYAFLKQVGQPQSTMELLARVVRRKLEQGPLQVSRQERERSQQVARKLLQAQNAEVYHQTGEYILGQRLLVAWTDARGAWQYGVGEVVDRRQSGEPHYRWLIRLRFPKGYERTYVAGADLSHPAAREWTPFSLDPDAETDWGMAVDKVLKVYGAFLLPHLIGQLDADPRFVRQSERYWLAEALPDLPEGTLDRVVTHLWRDGAPSSTDHLLHLTGLPVDEPHRWALDLALAADGRARESALAGRPAWTAPLPEDVLRLEDGTLIHLSTAPDELWSKLRDRFYRHLPKEWSDNPHVLLFGGRWLLDVLLMPLKDEDLRRVRDYLRRKEGAVSDIDILKDVFHITAEDSAFERWRFTLSYRLHEKAQHLGVEYVGSGQEWRWTAHPIPVVRPPRPHRLRGIEGLRARKVSLHKLAAQLAAGNEALDLPGEQAGGRWQPTRQTWEYVLTYYDWDNGILPYSRGAQSLIPPLSKGQRQAALHFVAEQMHDQPFQVALCRYSKAQWLYGEGLREFFQGYLVPGARVYIDRTEAALHYKIRYRPTPPSPRRILFFAEGRTRPEIREVDVECEVDEQMLLAEGRYTNVEGLARLDLLDRRTAPEVLARVFELVGERDEETGIFHASFEDLFPLLCVTKPYSKDYVRLILCDRRRYPWFRSDEARGPGWFSYDPCAHERVQTAATATVQPAAAPQLSRDRQREEWQPAGAPSKAQAGLARTARPSNPSLTHERHTQVSTGGDRAAASTQPSKSESATESLLAPGGPPVAPNQPRQLSLLPAPLEPQLAPGAPPSPSAPPEDVPPDTGPGQPTQPGEVSLSTDRPSLLAPPDSAASADVPVQMVRSAEQGEGAVVCPVEQPEPPPQGAEPQRGKRPRRLRCMPLALFAAIVLVACVLGLACTLCAALPSQNSRGGPSRITPTVPLSSSGASPSIESPQRFTGRWLPTMAVRVP